MNKQKVILDVRKTEQFEIESIPEARSIPIEELDSRLDELNKHADITIVCNHGGQRSQKALELLDKHGFTDTKILEGGIANWKKEQEHQ